MTNIPTNINISDADRRTMYNRRTYAKNKPVHQLRYYKNTYPQIFIDKQIEIQEYVCINPLPDSNFIEFIKTLIGNIGENGIRRNVRHVPYNNVFTKNYVV